MSEGLLDKRFILKKTTAISSNYPQGERVYDTRLERELDYPDIVDVLNILDEVVESLKRENSDLHMEIQRLVRGDIDE